jgi:hypothetical protein
MQYPAGPYKLHVTGLIADPGCLKPWVTTLNLPSVLSEK